MIIALTAVGLLAACSSSGEDQHDSSRSATSTSSSGAPGSGSTTSASSTSSCPKPATPKAKSRLPMLNCVYSDAVAAQAQHAGLTTKSTAPSAAFGILTLEYSHKGNMLASEPSVIILHEDNGQVAQLICSGVIGAKLDPVMSICADAGPPTRADGARVRAWALKASTELMKHPNDVIQGTASGMLFVACSDPRFPPPGGGGQKAQMQLFVQSPHGVFDATQCYHR